jgi:hypothetical protein
MMNNRKVEGGWHTGDNTQAPLAVKLKQDFPDVKYATRHSGSNLSYRACARFVPHLRPLDWTLPCAPTPQPRMRWLAQRTTSQP